LIGNQSFCFENATESRFRVFVALTRN
jgi:hypothetical protein